MVINLSHLLPAAITLAMVACAAEPSVRPGATGDPKAARRGLEAKLREGPVPLEIRGQPPVPERVLAGLAAQGVSGLAASFALETAADRPRLVLSFDLQEGSFAACGGEPMSPVARVGPTKLLAIYCDGRTPIAEVDGVAADTTEAAVERLVWRSTARLFPDDYEESYGLDLFGMRVRVDGSFGF